MQPTPRRFRFGAELRLRSKLQFDAIYAGGRRIDDRFFGLRVKPNGLTHPRIGLAVAVKTAGNAAGAFEVLADASYAAPNQAEALPEDGVAPLRSSLSIAVAGGRP